MFITSPLFAEQDSRLTYVLNQKLKEYNSLSGYLQILPEADRTYEVGEVAAQDDDAFIGWSEFQLNPPMANAFWSKITIKNAFNQDLNLVYYPGDRFTNYVDVYISQPGGSFVEYKDGVYLPRSQRAISMNRNEVNVPLYIPANSTVTIYSRIQNVDGKPVRFDVKVIPISEWQQSISAVNWIQGLFQGVLLLLGVFNLAMFVFLRRSHFAYYVAYVFCSSIYFLNFYGFTYDFFLGEYPISYLLIYILSTTLLQVFYLLFLRKFLDTAKLIPFWDMIMRLLLFVRIVECLGMGMVLITSFNFDFVQRVHQTFALAESLVILSLLFGFYQTRLKIAYFIIAGTMSLYVGLIVSILVFRFTASSSANYYFQAGVIMEVFVFALAQVYQLREEQLAKFKAEKASQAKADFLSTMSHEIRTPLNAVIGTTHLLLQEDPRADQVENLSTLRFSAENLLVLVNDILDFSKIEAGKIEFIDEDIDLRELLSVIRQTFGPSAEDKGLALEFSVEARVPDTVVTDGTRLNQVLMNLISNALKFTKNGKVKVEVDFLDFQDDKVSLEFSVTDTGIGIEKEKQKLIFDEFSQASSSTTREFGGSGLGLAIVKQLLALQGVEVQLESEQGRGSRFSFIQTFKNNPNALPVKVNTGKQPSLKPFPAVKVLLVEDNQVNVIIASKFLKKWGLLVDLAENGQEALEMVTMNHYDLVLMDLQMPLMDGYTATKEIRKFDQKLPIIALTASALNDVRERVFSVGMNDFVTKPFNPTTLYQKIKKHLRVDQEIRVEE